MKIVFIHCGVSIDNGQFIPRVYPDWIHHGICSISAYIKSRGYTDVSCINLCKLKNMDEFTAELIHNAGDADVFAVSMMTVDYNAAVACIQTIRRLIADSKIVVGGIHPTLMPNEVECVKEIDHIIMGEGELCFAQLLDDLKSNRPAKRVIRGTGVDNLDDLPPVDSHLMGRLESAYMPILPEPFVSIIAGRGCIYNCKFCQPSEKILFGKKVRRRSVAHVISELKQLDREFNFKSLMIHDDCLSEDKEWISLFCREYKKHGFTQPFFMQSRADFICRNEHLIEQLADAGLRLVSIGFESGSQRILNFLAKGTTVQQNIRASEICHKYGIKIKGNFMLGTPTETRQEALATLDMVKKIRPYRVSATFYTPLPGSYLYDYCIEHDLSLIHNHEEYNRSNLNREKIKGIDYPLLREIADEIISCHTFLEDNLKAKIDNLPVGDKNRLKILTFRSAPPEPVRNILDALNIWGLKSDFLVQDNMSAQFAGHDAIETAIAVEPGNITSESLSDILPGLSVAGYNLAIIPLNSWDYDSYADIICVAQQIGIRHMWGIAPNADITDLTPALVP